MVRGKGYAGQQDICLDGRILLEPARQRTARRGYDGQIQGATEEGWTDGTRARLVEHQRPRRQVAHAPLVPLGALRVQGVRHKLRGDPVAGEPRAADAISVGGRRGGGLGGAAERGGGADVRVAGLDQHPRHARGRQQHQESAGQQPGQGRGPALLHRLRQEGALVAGGGQAAAAAAAGAAGGADGPRDQGVGGGGEDSGADPGRGGGAVVARAGDRGVPRHEIAADRGAQDRAPPPGPLAAQLPPRPHPAERGAAGGGP
mmetsp:Transcript_2504/g.6831  ORF Transcript_2504/g.6831 Transcript_2504/m.6831 type:complete len:260 (+) Transcript_2504:286-1065(+)